MIDNTRHQQWQKVPFIYHTRTQTDYHLNSSNERYAYIVDAQPTVNNHKITGSGDANTLLVGDMSSWLYCGVRRCRRRRYRRRRRL